MFSLSAKAHYGLAAMLDLADNFGKERLQIRQIVEQRGIPKNYLEQIFNRLVKNGLVKSVRGNKGGYELFDSPRNLTVFSILEALEGPIGIVSQYDAKAVRQVFGNLEDRIREHFSISLEELLEEEKKYAEKRIYYI
ncbi:Rrf2 family transcriptional regulator [Prosthecochloris sp.]|uniref:RrF2 family transcriptional regulator n=1 Tax=Prosthecochloris sp. TaxID=290513 RepID=UPI0025D88F29|nr:Rrf2 family transcriptional regulator [Prosthecochloris sp.]